MPIEHRHRVTIRAKAHGLSIGMPDPVHDQKVAALAYNFLAAEREQSVGIRFGFGTERNSVTVLDRRGVIVKEVSGSKVSVANCILDLIG